MTHWNQSGQRWDEDKPNALAMWLALAWILFGGLYSLGYGIAFAAGEPALDWIAGS